MVRVDVRSEMLRWARDRAGLMPSDLRDRFPKLDAWESGAAKPTLKQLETYARVTRTPIGYLFLEAPPEERLPIPDFRTMAGSPVRRPSPDLLEMIDACQARQDWFREFAGGVGEPELGFIGSMTTNDSVEAAAERVRRELQFDLGARARCRSWEDALRLFVGHADHAGILVMVSGVVMNNGHRKLNPEEFRGFALADKLAPLVFINGSDSKSAQMFTLAHELAHLWLGQSALSDASAISAGQNAVETWCNRVAAETLAPLALVREDILRREEPLEQTVGRLMRRFKVSSLVVLQRLRDAGRLTAEAFRTAYLDEQQRLARLARSASSGGDFYATTRVRFGNRFARALVGSTLEGRTQYREAYRLLGISKPETFLALGRELHFTS